jgi:hypothetical protein
MTARTVQGIPSIPRNKVSGVRKNLFSLFHKLPKWTLGVMTFLGRGEKLRGSGSIGRFGEKGKPHCGQNK